MKLLIALLHIHWQNSWMLSFCVKSTKMIWQSSLHISDRLYNRYRNSKNLVKINHDDNITSTANLLSLPLWQNSLVRIENKLIYYKSWFSKGIQNRRQLIKDADNLLSFNEFKECFKFKTINYPVYHSAVSCIKLLRNAIENQNEKKNNRNSALL